MAAMFDEDISQLRRADPRRVPRGRARLWPRRPLRPGTANDSGRARLLPSGPGQVSPAEAVDARPPAGARPPLTPRAGRSPCLREPRPAPWPAARLLAPALRPRAEGGRRPLRPYPRAARG